MALRCVALLHLIRRPLTMIFFFSFSAFCLLYFRISERSGLRITITPASNHRPSTTKSTLALTSLPVHSVQSSSASPSLQVIGPFPGFSTASPLIDSFRPTYPFIHSHCYSIDSYTTGAYFVFNLQYSLVAVSMVVKPTQGNSIRSKAIQSSPIQSTR